MRWLNAGSICSAFETRSPAPDHAVVQSSQYLKATIAHRGRGNTRSTLRLHGHAHTPRPMLPPSRYRRQARKPSPCQRPRPLAWKPCGRRSRQEATQAPIGYASNCPSRCSDKLNKHANSGSFCFAALRRCGPNGQSLAPPTMLAESVRSTVASELTGKEASQKRLASITIPSNVMLNVRIALFGQAPSARSVDRTSSRPYKELIPVRSPK